MRKDRVVVKYYSGRMLLTVDLGALLNTLFDAYGDDVTIKFMAMDELERAASTDDSAAIPIARDRFQIFEIAERTDPRRTGSGAGGHRGRSQMTPPPIWISPRVAIEWGTDPLPSPASGANA